MKKIIHQITLVTYLIIVAMCFIAADLSEPGNLIRTTVEKVKRTVTEQKSKLTREELRDKIKEIISPVFDFSDMSRRSLGRHWNNVKNPKDREEFMKLFTDLLSKTYITRVIDNIEDSPVEYLNETKKEDKAIIRTKVTQKGDQFPVDYRMCLSEGSWKVCDVVIENVGLVSNYRTEFDGIIRNEGFSGLLERLRNKTEDAKVNPL